MASPEPVARLAHRMDSSGSSWSRIVERMPASLAGSCANSRSVRKVGVGPRTDQDAGRLTRPHEAILSSAETTGTPRDEHHRVHARAIRIGAPADVAQANAGRPRTPLRALYRARTRRRPDPRPGRSGRGHGESDHGQCRARARRLPVRTRQVEPETGRGAHRGYG